ncbi:gastrula zinc finger protein xLCGF3.1-like [Penaeus monodon]|uniref:gastrula zinc finger protein xLCGF3.1-like n=1 Tax=Penaeus monodon TaxID=6687 RepID=UPI0018A7516C|nr:gastrula zinc finger protein xLCGF3.1-like [Penaeus monodon]
MVKAVEAGGSLDVGTLLACLDAERRCRVCGKQFQPSPSWKQKLTRHLMTHSGEKPFYCPQCPHRCARKDSLKLHIARMHGSLPPI